jgi:hypothetical protein
MAMTKSQEEVVRANLVAFYGEEGAAKQAAITEKRLELLRKMEEAGCDLTPSGMSEHHMNDDPALYRQQARENEEARKREQGPSRSPA